MQCTCGTNMIDLADRATDQSSERHIITPAPHPPPQISGANSEPVQYTCMERRRPFIHRNNIGVMWNETVTLYSVVGRVIQTRNKKPFETCDPSSVTMASFECKCPRSDQYRTTVTHSNRREVRLPSSQIVAPTPDDLDKTGCEVTPL